MLPLYFPFDEFLVAYFHAPDYAMVKTAMRREGMSPLGEYLDRVFKIVKRKPDAEQKVCASVAHVATSFG
jgi:hypothetical protein